MTDDSKQPTHTKPLQQGIVLAGRYRLVELIGEAEGARIYEASDLHLSERRTAVCEVPGSDRELLAQTWVRAASAWTAALLDVVSIDGRVCAVFDLDDDACSLHGVAGVSREQRASLVVDTARVIERTAEAGVPVRVVSDHTLWVEGLPTEARLRVIPIPTPNHPAPESVAADLGALGRLAAQQLFGIEPTEAPQVALSKLPDALQAVLEPLYADAPDERLLAGARPDALLSVLGLTHGASRVPVPVLKGPPPTLGGQLTAAANRARRKTIRELGGAVVFLLFALTAFAPLLSGAVETSESGSVAVEDTKLSELVQTVPRPRVRTQPASNSLHPVQMAVLYNSVLRLGPVPEGHGLISSIDDVKVWLDHERVFVVEDRIVRVERFEPGSRLSTVTTYTYDDVGRLATESVYRSEGALFRSGTYTYDRSGLQGVYEGRLHTGAASPTNCASVAFRLDEEGRYVSRRCFDMAGEAASFVGGHHNALFEYDAERASLVTHTFRSPTGDRVQHHDGYYEMRETFNVDGRVRALEFYGRDGQTLVRDSSVGAARVQFAWEDGGLSSRQLFDRQGEPTLGAAGWHRFVEFRGPAGELVSSSTYGLDYRPTPQGTSEVARTAYESDENGLVREKAFYGVNGEPVTDASGVHRVEYIRDSHDNVLRECHFDLHSPMASPSLSGVSCVLSGQNELGFIISERFYGPNGEPTHESDSEVYGSDLERDAHHRVTRRTYYAIDRELAPTWAGYHAIEHDYDEWGRVIEFRYLNRDGQAAQTTTKVSTVRNRYDAASRVVRRCFFGGSEEPVPVPMATGFGANAHCLNWTYGGDQLEEIVYSDVDGNAVVAHFSTDSHRAAFLRFEWSNSGSLLTQDYYAENRRLIEQRVCENPRTCVAVNGWSWHLP